MTEFKNGTIFKVVDIEAMGMVENLGNDGLPDAWPWLMEALSMAVDAGAVVPVEPDGCQCEACTRKHKSDCNVHSGELRTPHGCTCGAWPPNLSECDAPFVCSFCGGSDE